MVSVPARSFLSLLLLGAGLAMPASVFARSQEGAIWTTTVTGDMSALRYGGLDRADLPLFLLSCFNDMGIAVLDVHDDLGQVKKGDKIAVEVASGKISAPLKGETASDEMDGDLYAEVSDFGIKPVLNVLKSDGPVTVVTGGTKRTFNDAGRADAVKEFESNCSLDD